MKTALLSIGLLSASFMHAQAPAEMVIYGQYTNLCVATNCAQAYFGQTTGMVACDLATGKVYHYDPQNSGLNGSVDAISLDADGNIWTVGSDGVYKIAGETVERIQLYYENNSPLVIPNLKHIRIDNYGRFFLATGYGSIYQFDHTTGVCKEMPDIMMQNGFAITQNSDGQVYAAGVSLNIIRLYAIGETCSLIGEMNLSPIENKSISNFIIDDNNNFWISFLPQYSWGKEEYIAEDGGLVVCSEGVWTVISADMYEQSAGLRGFNVRAIDANGSAIAIYSDTENMKEYVSFAIDDITHTAYANERNIQLPYTTLFARDAFDRDIYLSGSEAYVIEQNTELRIVADRPYITSGVTQTDNENNIWIANSGRLTKIFPNQDYAAYYYSEVVPADFYPWQMVIDEQNTVWLLDRDELLEFNGSNFVLHDRSWANMDTCNDPFLELHIDDYGGWWVLCEQYLMHKEIGFDWEKIDIPFNTVEEDASKMICSAGNICIISESAAYAFDGSEWVVYDALNSPLELSGYSSSLGPDYNGGFYIGSIDGFYQLNDTGLVKLRPIDVSDINVDRNTGVVWYNYENEVFRFTPPSLYQQLLNFPDLSSSMVMTIDKSSNLILNSRGVIYLYNQTGIVEHTYPDFETPQQFSAEFCREATDDLHIMSVYPNPAVDVIQFYFEQQISGAYQVAIYNMQGERVKLQDAEAVLLGGNTGSFNIKNLPKGTYVMHAFSDVISSSATFIKL